MASKNNGINDNVSYQHSHMIIMWCNYHESKTKESDKILYSDYDLNTKMEWRVHVQSWFTGEMVRYTYNGNHHSQPRLSATGNDN